MTELVKKVFEKLGALSGNGSPCFSEKGVLEPHEFELEMIQGVRGF
jgi:hypothetical protein